MNIFFPNASIEWPTYLGPSIHRYQLVKHWKEFGHNVVTLEPDQNPLAEVRPKTSCSVLKSIRNADVIYCRTQEHFGPATGLTLPLKRWIIRSKTPVIWEVNIALDLKVISQDSRDEQDFNSYFKQLYSAAKRVDAAVAVTESIAKQVQDRLGIQDVRVMQNGSDPNQFDPSITPHPDVKVDDRLRVVWIGSMANAIHDVDLIKNLVRTICHEKLPIVVHVIGQTRDLFASSEFGRAKSDGYLVLHGPVQYQELPRYLSPMHVGLAVYNIVYDGGSPLKLFDYLSSECVPICSLGQPMEAVVGKLMPGGQKRWSIPELATYLMSLHTDRAHLRELASKGRKIIVDQYNWACISRQIETLMIEKRMLRSGV